MVLPHFDYCAHIWNNTDMKAKNIIIRLHKRGCRMILRVPKMTPTQDVLRELKWCSLQDRWDKSKNCFMNKLINKQCPDYSTMKEYFVKVQQCHNHNTRHAESNGLHQIKIKSESGRRTFQYSGAKNWNALPASLRKSESYNVFKSDYNKPS